MVKVAHSHQPGIFILHSGSGCGGSHCGCLVLTEFPLVFLFSVTVRADGWEQSFLLAGNLSGASQHWSRDADCRAGIHRMRVCAVASSLADWLGGDCSRWMESCCYWSCICWGLDQWLKKFSLVQ